MGIWYRVFGALPDPPEPAALLGHLNGVALVRGRFDGDGRNWFVADLSFADSAAPLHLERFLADEEGIRDELNSWAAYLETCDYSPRAPALMERVIQSAQLFTLRRPTGPADELLVDQLCAGLCSFLAARTAGFWQADGQGIYAADGTLMVQEE
jgi:hypothetical protein